MKDLPDGNISLADSDWQSHSWTKTLVSERRKFRRFLAQDRAFAVLRPDFTRLGKISDISKKGRRAPVASPYAQARGSGEQASEDETLRLGEEVR